MAMPTPAAHFPALRTLCEAILANATAHAWTLQGFGMLRLHLPNDYRLHVWHSGFTVPGVSTIHDHLQWGLESTIICGNLENRLFEIGQGRDAEDYQFVVLKPGVGTRFKSEPERCWLRCASRREYLAGETYAQRPHEIHESRPIDGTVTVMRKQPTNDESARVFWPANEQWVSAEPHPATPDQVATMTACALAQLRSES